MPSYKVKQIAYRSSETYVDQILCSVAEVQGSAQTGDDPRNAPYQQIVIRPKEQIFSSSETYFLELSIPKDQNYDLQFGIRLVELGSTESVDLDSLNYQFIRYITSYKLSNKMNDSSRVVLFQEPNGQGEFVDDDPNYPIQVAIAEQVDEPQISGSGLPYKANTMYYYQQNEESDIYYY